MLVEAHAKGLIENPHIYGDDFGSPDETYISNQFDKPVMVHRYPAAVKAFYMQPDPKDATKALCETARGPNPKTQQSPCVDVPIADASWSPTHGGFLGAWYEYREEPFPRPFPPIRRA